MAIFFDISYYLPLQQRNRKSPRENPYHEEQFVLGGAFFQGSLYKEPKILEDKVTSRWIWQQPEFDHYGNYIPQEELLLENIFNLLRNEYQRMLQMGKKSSYYLVGMGISNFDIPLLYNRSLLCDFAPPEKLYEVYYHAVPIDLASSAIAFRKKSGGLTLQPMKISEIKSQLASSYKTLSDIEMWELYDSLQYSKIEEYIKLEVTQIVNLYHQIRSTIGQ